MSVPLTTKEAKRLVVECLGARLGPEFVFKKADECFLRRTAAGADLLFVGFWAYPPKFVFSVTPAVRIDEIETLYRQVFAPQLPTGASLSKSVTVLTQLWRLDGPTRSERDVPLPDSGSPYYFPFTDRASLQGVVDSLESRLEGQVARFYGGLRSTAEAHAALNIEGLDTSNSRIFHGIVAAYLADREGRRSYAARYRDELTQWPAPDQERFRCAVERLEALD